MKEKSRRKNLGENKPQKVLVEFAIGLLINLFVISLYYVFNPEITAYFWRHYLPLRFFGAILIFLALDAAIIIALLWKRKKYMALGVISAFVAALLGAGLSPITARWFG